MSKKNEEKAKEITKDYAPTIENLDAKIVLYDAIMEMAKWKDSQCLGTLLRVFDLIANKRDAGEALQYIKKTLEFIIKDHYGDANKNKINKTIMKSYCNLMCIGNSENCISLAPCKNYNNIINIISEIDSNENK